jgi:hypothetical protein
VDEYSVIPGIRDGEKQEIPLKVEESKLQLDALRTAARAVEREDKAERLREINKDIEALESKDSSAKKQADIKERIKKMMSSSGASNNIYDTIEDGRPRGMTSIG